MKYICDKYIYAGGTGRKLCYNSLKMFPCGECVFPFCMYYWKQLFNKNRGDN